MKTRAPKGSRPVREPTHVTAAQALSLHEYCVTMGDIWDAINYSRRMAEKRSVNAHIPTDLRPVCEHPSHGWCSHNLPSEKEVEKINSRLSGISVELPESGTDVGYPLPGGQMAYKKRIRRKSRNHEKHDRYFCLHCKEWHEEEVSISPAAFREHKKYKRGRGRPKQ